jgi:hypothetical protein
MTAATITRILSIGTITGMRSMAGAATLASRHGTLLKATAALMAAGEMAADKTSLVGNRTDAVPLIGRAGMGALLGGLVARDHHEGVALGGLLGAATAILATHLAYQIRTRLPLSTTAGGVLEDAIVVSAGMLYAWKAEGARRSPGAQT